MSQCLINLISITDNSKINLFVNHIINQVPVPYKNQKIKFYSPVKANPIKLVNPFILNSTNFKPDNIFEYFSVENIITIFYLSLLEQQLLFIDNDHSLLSSISYLFTNLTYPMSWIDTYIPILSLSSISFLQSIVPFIMGSSEFLVNYAINNSYIGEQTSPRVSFIHIKNNLISMEVKSLLEKKKGMSRKNILKYLELPQIPEGLEKIMVKKLKSEDFLSELAKFYTGAKDKYSVYLTIKRLYLEKQKYKKNPAKRTFQAFRIYVNRELDVIDLALDRVVNRVSNGGRICVITFNSLEDRIVKNKVKYFENHCTCPKGYPCVCGEKSLGKMLNKKAITASEAELLSNRRSKPAKLRIFERGYDD